MVLLIRRPRARRVEEAILVRNEADLKAIHFCVADCAATRRVEVVGLADFHRLYTDTPGLKTHESPDAYMHEQVMQDINHGHAGKPLRPES